jgi:hypothetical protein
MSPSSCGPSSRGRRVGDFVVASAHRVVEQPQQREIRFGDALGALQAPRLAFCAADDRQRGVELA